MTAPCSESAQKENVPLHSVAHIYVFLTKDSNQSLKAIVTTVWKPLILNNYLASLNVITNSGLPCRRCFPGIPVSNRLRNSNDGRRNESYTANGRAYTSRIQKCIRLNKLARVIFISIMWPPKRSISVTISSKIAAVS